MLRFMGQNQATVGSQLIGFTPQPIQKNLETEFGQTDLSLSAGPGWNGKSPENRVFEKLRVDASPAALIADHRGFHWFSVRDLRHRTVMTSGRNLSVKADRVARCALIRRVRRE